MIEIKGLNKIYKDTPGITDFDFTFRSGNIYGLCGPIGAGKTTLIKLITEFLKKDSGDIIRDFSNNEMLYNISYFPDFEIFVPGTVKKNIEFFTLTYNDTDMDLLYKLLNEYEINLKDRIDELSTGKKKALRYVLTISRNVKVYIMDEPFANIDIKTRKQFSDDLFKHVDIENSIVIISSHELHDMDSLLDEVLLIKKSQLIKSVSVEDIKSKEGISLVDWYLKEV